MSAEKNTAAIGFEQKIWEAAIPSVETARSHELEDEIRVQLGSIGTEF